MMHVYWLEQTEADTPAENCWLGATEMAHLDGLRIPKRRADWRLGRWTAKLAVAGYLKLPGHPHALAGVEIRPAPSGAPEVFIANEPAPVTISISHRTGRAVCVVAQAGAAIGCDLEIVEQRSEAFMTDYFAAEEQALAARASPADRDRLLTLFWSAKESGLKALRTGLRLDTRCVVVTPVDSQALDTWRALQVRCTNGPSFHGWWQATGNLMRTLVTAPRSAEPILLPEEELP